MTITSAENLFDKNILKPSCSKSSNFKAFNSQKIGYITNTSSNSNNSKYENSKTDKYASPYLSNNKDQLARLTEKRFLHKMNGFKSSSQAINIYKANSDDLRSSKRCCKKTKKSVLTLPNEPVPLPQATTVSDMNDSEYFNDEKDHIKLKTKKRKVQNRKQLALMDRQIDHSNDLDKSSKEMINKFNRNDKNKSKTIQNKSSTVKSNFNGHNVWSLLRNVNQFKFRPSPSVSQESSVISVKKNKRKKNNKLRGIRNNTRLIETRQTEEFSYISSYIDNPQYSFSQSSFDRVTVIERDEIQTFYSSEEKEVDKSTTPHIAHHGNKINQLYIDGSTKLKKNLMKVTHVKEKKDKVLNSLKIRPMIKQSNDTYDRSTRYQNNEITLLNDIKNDNNKSVEIKLNKDMDIISKSQFNNFDNHSNSSKKSYNFQNDKRKLKSNIPNKDILVKEATNKPQQHVSGITKVVCSKGEDILLTTQVDAIQRKSSVMENSIVSTKPKVSLKLSEIRRRLNSMKFPLVVLAKDQLSSTVTVENYDPPQFAGLNEHIWPFMRIWYDENNYNSFTNNNRNENFQTLNLNRVGDYISKGKNNTSFANDDKSKEPFTQIKPMSGIKNRVMRFMNKKVVPENEVCKTNYSSTTQKHGNKVIDICTNTPKNLLQPKQENMSLQGDAKIPKNVSYTYVKPKSKWVNEFIGNVIKKIRNGVYYNQDDNNEFKGHHNKTKEEGAQTEIENLKLQSVKNLVCNVTPEEYDIANENNSIIAIPGFGKRLSNVEIESLNDFNQVTVKHCVTNIIIQFDVEVSFKNPVLQMKQSYTCIPISPVKNQPKIFKCKTSIINAILPAELCSILPGLMEKIIYSNSKMTLPTSAVDKGCCSLSTISELSRYEDDLNKITIPIHMNSKSNVNIITNGYFSSPNIPKSVVKRNIKLESRQSFDVTQKLIALNVTLPIFGGIDTINLTTKHQLHRDITPIQKRLFICKALEPYQYSAKQILSSHENYSFRRIVETILNSKNRRFTINASNNCNVKLIFYINNLNINFVKKNKSDVSQFNFAIPTNKSLPIDLRGNLISDKVTLAPDLNTYYSSKAITNVNHKRTSNPDKLKTAVEFCTNKNKNKKRGFVKLYKKCKSMSNISASKSSMNLDKITNLEEFCLALGSVRMLSVVLDGNTGRKILSSIREVKNWMTDITPRQALLILLLANKKDTINLVRYRPIILQGIAVNRITLASELDMEVEVIERENLNKLNSQYEGITYLPASEKNQDTLLEELYWIAKTTASDYQKPFDESSERLLRSLLEKRKKLNPSYLRVMARYVGLGLLKTSK